MQLYAERELDDPALKGVLDGVPATKVVKCRGTPDDDSINVFLVWAPGLMTVLQQLEANAKPCDAEVTEVAPGLYMWREYVS